jgi:methionyl-tRNA formyltransferase
MPLTAADRGEHQLPIDKEVNIMAHTPARIVFISGHQFGAKALLGIMESDAFQNAKIEIVSLLGLHPRYALRTVGFFDFTLFANNHHLPFATFSSVGHDAVFNHLQEIQFDYLLVIGLSQIVPKRILELPGYWNGGKTTNSAGYGCIGMHPTLLPKGRGRAPLPWTVLHNIEVTGVTAFILEDRPDSGGIVDQETLVRDPATNVANLFHLAGKAHFTLGNRLSARLGKRALKWLPQGVDQATEWGKRKPEDGWLDFRQTARQLELLIRAAGAPYPRSFFTYGASIVKIDKVEIVTLKEHGDPEIMEVDSAGNPTVATSDDCLKLTEWSHGTVSPDFVVGDIIQDSRGRILDESE